MPEIFKIGDHLRPDSVHNFKIGGIPTKSYGTVEYEYEVYSKSPIDSVHNFKIGDKVYCIPTKSYGTVECEYKVYSKSPIEIRSIDGGLKRFHHRKLRHVTDEEFTAAEVLNA